MLPEKLGFSIISLKNYIGANTLMTRQETSNLLGISISFVLKKIHQSKPVGRTIIRELLDWYSMSSLFIRSLHSI